MASTVSERYALSLYEVAKDEGKAAEMLEELDAVSRICKSSPDLIKVLKTPSIQFSEKKTMLETIFAGRIDQYLLNFLMLITEKGRAGLLHEMAQSYKEQYYFDEGVCEVTAITAAPMDKQLSDKLRKKMCAVTGKKVVLQTKVDPALIGGIVVKVNNEQIDTSVRTRLEELAQQLTQTIA